MATDAARLRQAPNFYIGEKRGVQKTLRVINELEKKSLIANYAIGGGIAAIFYMEPVLTYDLDLFILVPHTAGEIISLSALYDFLSGKGYKPSHEHVVIEGVPVQLIPAYNELVEEAIIEAREIEYKKTRTRVLRVEHLLAVMLQTDRPKDRTRIVQLLEETSVNMDDLMDILRRHGLLRKWQKFRRRFYGD